jgi:hypothetical protein
VEEVQSDVEDDAEEVDDDDDYNDADDSKMGDTDGSRSPGKRGKHKGPPVEERVGLEDDISDESADSIDDDVGVRQALTEAFIAKNKRQAAVMGTGSGTDAALQTGYVSACRHCHAFRDFLLQGFRFACVSM